MKKISVIVPAYNCAAYIEKCIDSLLDMNRGDLEIIVVNDGSTDETYDKILKYAGKIIVIDKQNGGAASARNSGLSVARGEYILFCDSDDYYDKNAVETLLKYAEESGADIVRAGYRVVYSDGGEKLPKNRFTENETVEKADFKERVYPYFINGIMLNTTCAALYRRSIIDGIRFRTDMKTGEDAVFNIEAFTRAQRVMFVSNVCYNYVRVSGSLTGNALGIAEKYRCNFMISRAALKKLDEWGMNTLKWRMKTITRPIRLTFDKIARLRK
ncbi:MAG: glycosyltransferase [Firmicutes bacterium]|nr:glycosyltransferase [Bacillota bacterium]